MADPPLAGVRVLDFTWVVAGPVACRILADNGAEVIKLERKIPGTLGPRRIGLQGDLNRNKRSVAINMGTVRGVELARKLALVSDIVIDNFSARVMRGWGMDYANLTELKPDIICISMSGLGHTGPRASYVSYGPTLQALSGYTMMMRDGGEPAGFGYSYADMAGGYTGALAALIALWNRKRTGKGQFVDLSQFESVASVIGPALLDISVNGRSQEAPLWRSQEGAASPHGVYRCRPAIGAGAGSAANSDAADADRWIAISVRSQPEWERFVSAIGSPAWASEPRFRTMFLRMRNRTELDANVARWTADRDAEEAMAILQRYRVAAGVVSNGADLCERDPQLAARGFWPSVRLADGTTTQVTGIPFRLSRTPGSVRTVAPEIGDDNDYVLGQLLGLSAYERAELIASGAVWP
jgi:crotonobetainyl-CoA:carnitine CoA-transferase CaiB-like acyl-CoA transferase